MNRGWAALVALVLLSSAVPLVQVMYDRSTPPRQTLTVSQREVQRAWGHDENTGELLGWSWRRSPELDSVTPERLAEIGIRCRGERYDCSLRSGRNGWMVIAVDTVSWRRSIDSLQRVMDSIAAVTPQDSQTVRDHRERVQRMEGLARRESRLILVDVGRDGDALLARWNDGAHLVIPARLTAFRQSWARDSGRMEPRLFRVHAEPVPSRLYVGGPWAEVVRDTTWDRRGEYRVTVGVGRRWLPRVLDVTK